MRIIAKKILREFWQKNNDAEQQLKIWYRGVSRTSWTIPSDVKAKFTKASILRSGRVVFNVCGNKYRLVVKINYQRQWVFIRFIGTHSDYDKIDANTI